MPDRPRPRRKPLGYLDAQDRALSLRQIYQSRAFGADHAKAIAQKHHEALDDTRMPEPDEELEDSDLADVERRAAMARERMRRQGLL